MYVSLCSVLTPKNWSAYLPNKGNSLLTYFPEVLLLPSLRFTLTHLFPPVESYIPGLFAIIMVVYSSSYFSLDQ